MGQRLVINCYDKDNNRIGNLYYHWSAYTGSSYEEVYKLYKAYEEEPETDDKQLRLIHVSEKLGGGIPGYYYKDDFYKKDWSEREYIENKFNNETFKTEDINRNDGLVSISPQGMEISDIFAEGVCDLNIDTGILEYNDNLWGFDSMDQYIEEVQLDEEEIPPISYICPYDLQDIDIDTCKKVSDWIYDIAYNKDMFGFYDKNKYFYQLIM